VGARRLRERAEYGITSMLFHRMTANVLVVAQPPEFMFALGTPSLLRAVCASNSARYSGIERLPVLTSSRDAYRRGLSGFRSESVGKQRRSTLRAGANVAHVRAIRASVCSQPPRHYLS